MAVKVITHESVHDDNVSRARNSPEPSLTNDIDVSLKLVEKVILVVHVVKGRVWIIVS